MNAPDSVAVPETAAGGTVDLSVDLTAPVGDGTYTTHFSLHSAAGESVAIGAEKTFYARVIVSAGNASMKARFPRLWSLWKCVWVRHSGPKMRS